MSMFKQYYIAEGSPVHHNAWCRAIAEHDHSLHYEAVTANEARVRGKRACGICGGGGVKP